jgi:hypothetical protein
MAGSVFAVACVIFLAASPAPDADADELARRIKPGRQVFVLDWTGAERAGTVVDVSARGITVDQKDGSRLTIPVESIARVQRVDRLWNGFLIGAAIAPTLFAFAKVVDSSSVNWTSSHTAYTVLYAVIGIWCDWLREGRSDLYKAERGPAFSLGPLIGPRAIGTGVRITF